MQYNDYPDSLPDSVVDAMNATYTSSITANTLSSIDDKLGVAIGNSAVASVGKCIMQVESYLEVLLDMDKRHQSVVGEQLQATRALKEVYCASAATVNFVRPKNFHRACVNYVSAELDLICALSACVMVSTAISNYANIIGDRLNRLKKIVLLYT